jgi:hypothetical protein
MATLIEALSPSYFPNSAGKRGRPPIGLERMLRIYFLQQWYALADEALEDAIYDSQAMRDFIGIDLAIESVPDATTLLRFRHLLEKHALTQRIFEEINATWPSKAVHARGHHRRRHHRGGRSLHQEQGQAARSGDEADQEGQPVVFRPEGPYRRRCRHRADPQCRRHLGQRCRCHHGRPSGPG